NREENQDSGSCLSNKLPTKKGSRLLFCRRIQLHSAFMSGGTWPEFVESGPFVTVFFS
ncbi:Uncharacterized protein APZ42_013506, partial [Daphnia magna]